MSLCFRLMKAWRFMHAQGPLNFKPPPQLQGVEYFELPCSKCIGCRLHRAGQWALRCMHEARYHERRSFLTLTYATPHLPQHRSLLKADFQKFMKRLRIHLSREYGIDQLKYFMVGEYGENRDRPHYHVLLYGYDFPDKVMVPNNPDAEHPLFESVELDRLWKWGICKVGNLSYDSCNYVARYTMKKQYGPNGDKEYAATKRIPPYNNCSKGIGNRYYREFSGDCYPSDYLIHEDTKARVPLPRYYDKLLEQVDPEAFAKVKARRKEEAKKHAKLHAKDRTPERMSVREQILLLKTKRLGRRYEEDTGQHSRPQGQDVHVHSPLQQPRGREPLVLRRD